MRPEDLHGEALAAYKTWRGMGLSEAQAIDEVERSATGRSATAQYTELVETYRRRGMSEQAARTAAAGRDRGGVPLVESSFDELVETYKRRGMSPEAARLAAIGRDGTTERRARKEHWESGAITRRAQELIEAGEGAEGAWRKATDEVRSAGPGPAAA